MELLVHELSVAELFNTYSYDVLAYSASLLKNRDDAKDALQEVFIRFMKSRNEFKNNCSVKTWLLIITRNYCYTKLKEKKGAEVTLDESFLLKDSFNIEMHISLQEAFSKLTVDEYELIYLKEFAGYSYKEISEILGITIPNAKVKLFRIRKQLKEYLK